MSRTKPVLPTLIVGAVLIFGLGAYYFFQLPAEPAPPATYAELGQQLTTTYCADCHATGPTGQSPRIGAPTFRDLHQRYDIELLSEALVEGLFAHPEMPEFEFDPQQAEAIISYLSTLEAE